MTAVKVQFQIGHSSKLRSKKTVEGFTHDWELYVKGINQSDISAFVEKIIFNLHESFQKPKRVCSKPPYCIQESGYAGFVVFIDIYFRNRDEPKKVQFSYDLDLQTTGPPQHRHEIKTFIFDNPSEEFRQKLLKNGGVPVSGVVAGVQPAINNNIVAMPQTGSLNHALAEAHKTITSEGKKHKLRPDDTRSNSFANLFGPPITKTSTVPPTVTSKHSPDSKTVVAAAHATHQPTAATGMPVIKEKSSKDKEKPSEKSKERSEKREKHHKQSLTSPHKEGRSESKKTDGSKHEKREKTEEKSKKDKNRDKERERDREKTSGATVNNNTSSSKRPPSPKPAREQSPHKPMASAPVPTNTSAINNNSLPRPSSSSSGKIEEAKLSSKSSSKESTGEHKSKDIKQKEISSSSSGKKSKKDKKDRDKERDKDKRHEEKEKQKLSENQQRPGAKEDSAKINNNINTHSNNTATQDSKNSKAAITPLNANTANDINKKPEKVAKQDLFKTSSDKNPVSGTAPLAAPALVPAASNSGHSSTDKKSSSSSSLNSNSNQPEKDKRSHKHKKKEKNKDKDKDRERDKERDKDKDKERDKEKDKEKETKKEKEAKDKHAEEKNPDLNSISAKHLLAPATNNSSEEHASTISPSSISSTTNSAATPLATTPTIPASSALPSSSSKSSKNKEKKSKEKSSSKEEKLKHKITDAADASESKAKQPKLSNSNFINTSSAVSSSSTSLSVTTAVSNAITSQTPNSAQPNAAATLTVSGTAEASLNLELSGGDSLPAGSRQLMPPSSNDATKKSLLKQPSPLITHSDSSDSSFPDLPPLSKPSVSAHPPPPKQPAVRERSKSIAAPITAPPASVTFVNPSPKEPPKPIKAAAKEKPADKPAKEEEKEKKRRRNSQAVVNTFIEPPVKQLKTKEPTKSVREKSKSPSLRNTGSRASISVDSAATFLQPSASPSSAAAAAPLPPPSSAPSAAHSPALSATEAVGNATSATANAATCNNSNSAASSTTNSANMAAAAAHHLPLEYLSELQELHHKIMTLQDNEDLQHVVELIAATGCYEITTKTFDFDLCKLDRGTVQRLQDFFATSVS